MSNIKRVFIFYMETILKRVVLHRTQIRTACLPRQQSTFSVLGIETSCDDTGIALVQSDKKVVANVVYSQEKQHLRYGGIIPPRAGELHRIHIEDTYKKCMTQAGVEPSAIEAIAVTTRPGLPLSLLVGLRFARHLARTLSKPIIPIHHMEAHALTVRMEQPVDFPFICLLISGGHSQLAFVEKATKFYLLGECIDDAPGEAFDKISRLLRLRTIPRFSSINGGQAIEIAAKEATDPERYQFPLPLARYRDCNFSFAGIKNSARRNIKATEREEKTYPDGVISHYRDFCAGFLKMVAKHICHRTQRAIEFCIRKEFFKDSKLRIVVAGGVANNDFIFRSVANVATSFGGEAFRPSKLYCSDNGAMIAWNGIEKLFEDRNCAIRNYYDLDIVGKSSLGISLIDQVTAEDIKCKWIKMPPLQVAEK